MPVGLRALTAVFIVGSREATLRDRLLVSKPLAARFSGVFTRLRPRANSAGLEFGNAGAANSMPPDRLSSPNARSFSAMGGASITLKRFLAFAPREGRPRLVFCFGAPAILSAPMRHSWSANYYTHL